MPREAAVYAKPDKYTVKVSSGFGNRPIVSAKEPEPRADYSIFEGADTFHEVGHSDRGRQIFRASSAA